ncbi:MAG: response regulator transcription factor [Hyalangium sp.]|uniref:response regulator transcription factor n=1 Tax=Hyalangium sp. TaxID=2028555 RepID=UPI00389A4521
METPLPPGSRVLLIIAEPQAPRAAGAQGPAPAGELIIGSRHYHLVPAPSEEPAPTPAPTLPDAQLLTARELQVASRVAAGQVNKQIAADLQISAWTVAAHLRRIFSKLGVENRAAMVSRCFGAQPGPRSP